MKNLLVLVGRSGSGRLDILQNLVEHWNYEPAVITTTCSKRGSRLDYSTISTPEFNALVKKDAFATWGVSGKEGDAYGILKSSLKHDGNVVAILPLDAAEELMESYPGACIVHVDIDLKTAVIRTIEREEYLDRAALHKITTKCLTDSFIYTNVKCHYSCRNAKDIPLQEVVWDIYCAHENWMKEHKEV